MISKTLFDHILQCLVPSQHLLDIGKLLTNSSIKSSENWTAPASLQVPKCTGPIHVGRYFGCPRLLAHDLLMADTVQISCVFVDGAHYSHEQA